MNSNLPDLFHPDVAFEKILNDSNEVDIQYLQGGKVAVMLGRLFPDSYFEATILRPSIISMNRFTRNDLREWAASGNYNYIYCSKTNTWSYVDDKLELRQLNLRYVSALEQIVQVIEKGLKAHLDRIDSFQFG